MCADWDIFSGWSCAQINYSWPSHRVGAWRDYSCRAWFYVQLKQNFSVHRKFRAIENFTFIRLMSFNGMQSRKFPPRSSESSWKKFSTKVSARKFCGKSKFMTAMKRQSSAVDIKALWFINLQFSFAKICQHACDRKAIKILKRNFLYLRGIKNRRQIFLCVLIIF